MTLVLSLLNCSLFVSGEISQKCSIPYQVPTTGSPVTSLCLAAQFSGFCSLHVTELTHHLLDPTDPLQILPGFASLQHTICHSSLLDILSLLFFFFNFFLPCIYFWETERDRAWVGEGQRERETESEAGSRLRAVSTEPDRTWTHRLRDHDLSQSWMLNRLSHPGAPTFCLFLISRQHAPLVLPLPFSTNLSLSCWLHFSSSLS